MKTYFAINGDYRIDYGLEYAVLYWFTENEQYILDKLHKIAFERKRSIIDVWQNYRDIDMISL